MIKALAGKENFSARAFISRCYYDAVPDGSIRSRYNQMDDFRGILKGNPISPDRVPSERVAKKSRNTKIPGLSVAGAEGIPSCGARKTLRACADPCVFRPLRQPLLAASSTGCARRRCPARGFGGDVETSLNHNTFCLSQPLARF